VKQDVHRAHQISCVLKTCFTKKRLAQTFPLDLEFLSTADATSGIVRELRDGNAPCPPDRQRQSQRLVPNRPRALSGFNIATPLSHPRPISCGKDISWFGVGKKVAVLSLPCLFPCHLFQQRASFCSLAGIAGELLEMDAVLLNLHVKEMEGALGFQEAYVFVGHECGSKMLTDLKMRLE
jgi:hypothetical protein